MRPGTDSEPSSTGDESDGPAVVVAVRPELAPGENTRGAVNGAAWSYLLPDRDLGTILCLGQPTASTLATLLQIGKELIVARGERRRPLRLPGIRSQRGPTLMEVAPGGDSRWPLADGSISLVIIAGPWWSRRLARDPGLEADLDRVLAAEGHLFVHLPGAATGDDGTAGSSLLPRGFGTRDLLWLGARAGEVRAVVPAAERPLIDFVMARWDQDREPRSPLRGVSRLLKGRAWRPGVVQELGALRARGGGAELAQPPRYIRQAAAAAGLSIDHHRWALLDPAAYSTKKLLLFLFPPDQAKPEFVVKLVRDARFNARLANTWRALVALDRGVPSLRGACPRPVFFGRHAGLTFLAETALEGTPLKQRMSGEPDDPLAHAMVDWLLGLGLATADASIASPAAVAAELRGMLEHYCEIYLPGRRQRDMLAALIGTIADRAQLIPLVFQHGDAGTWNVLVDAEGRLALLDWEAAVPHGMPLWDLFYFLRSFGVGTARLNGIRDPLEAFERHFLRVSPLGRLLVEATERFCAGAGLDRSLVEPLFYTCWMHRALKQSSTLRPARLPRGHYANLLRHCLEHRDAPGLRLLFGGGATSRT